MVACCRTSRLVRNPRYLAARFSHRPHAPEGGGPLFSYVSLVRQRVKDARTNPRRSRTRTLLISCPRLWEDRLLIASAPAFLRCSTTFENLTTSRTFSYGHRGRSSNQPHFRFSFRGCWSSKMMVMMMLDTDRHSTRLPTLLHPSFGERKWRAYRGLSIRQIPTIGRKLIKLLRNLFRFFIQVIQYTKYNIVIV